MELVEVDNLKVVIMIRIEMKILEVVGALVDWGVVTVEEDQWRFALIMLVDIVNTETSTSAVIFDM